MSVPFLQVRRQLRAHWFRNLLTVGAVSLAVLLFAFLEFAAGVGQPLDAKCERLHAWYARVAARPSVAG